ncbi:MAG: Hsp20/alpha crystallin family protein [Verrucomicrobia bacterium]|nr:Hsp20/alpha crystallin family protein [Verrucomicrobiota bacterium]
MYKATSSLQFIKTTRAGSDREHAVETNWVPNTDVYVTDGGVVIKVELAGLRKEDLELAIEGNRLRISGYRSDGCRSAKCNFQLMEINYGAFENCIELPPGYDLGRAVAAYQNGFLRIDVPVLGGSESGTGHA